MTSALDSPPGPGAGRRDGTGSDRRGAGPIRGPEGRFREKKSCWFTGQELDCRRIRCSAAERKCQVVGRASVSERITVRDSGSPPVPAEIGSHPLPEDQRRASPILGRGSVTSSIPQRTRTRVCQNPCPRLHLLSPSADRLPFGGRPGGPGRAAGRRPRLLRGTPRASPGNLRRRMFLVHGETL